MRTIVLIAVLSVAAACQTEREPRRVLGSTPERAAADLGVRFDAWSAWVEGAPFEASCDATSKASYFGLEWTVCAVRDGDRVVGIELRRRDTRDDEWRELRRRAARAYRVDDDPAEPDIYAIQSGGRVVRLWRTSDGAVTLVVTDGPFGKAYAAQVLKEGFGDLERGLTPH